MGKKYYWLKLKERFFDSLAMKKLRKIAGGDTYTIIYLKMQLLSIKNEGYIFFEGLENDFAAEMALALDEDEENVRITITFLLNCNLLEQQNEQIYFLPGVIDCIGKEDSNTENVRRFRERQKQKLLQCNNDVKKCKTEIEIEKDINMLTDGEQVSQKNDNEAELKENFEKIYAIYPRKKGKQRAYQIYKAYVTKGRRVSGQNLKYTNRELYLAVRKYVKEQEEEGTELVYYKYFDTLLNQISDYMEG